MEKINKIRVSLISIIVIFLIATIFTLLLTSLWKFNKPKLYTSAYTTREIWKYPCLKKGNVCSDTDIANAIKVLIPVNEKEKKSFYLLSNDEDTATFIMDSNIVQRADWHGERVNIKGPANALAQLANITKEWTNIPVIEHYEYEDEGLAYTKRICSLDEKTIEELQYDCTNDLIPSRGYNGAVIDKGVITVYFNLPEDENNEVLITKETSFPGLQSRVRMVELRELEKVSKLTKGYPDWLIDNVSERGGYWTMSSSTLQPSGYMQGAYAVVNEKGQGRDLELYTISNQNYHYKDIGLRPVITIKKQEKY